MDHDLLELQGITKIFPGIVACDNVSLAVRNGSIRGLVGENGAGKTTLMRVVFGMYQAEAGRMLLRGEEIRFQTPRDAMSAGIAMVHQQSMLVPTMSVIENILLAKPNGSFLRPQKLREQLRPVMEKYSIHLDETRTAGELSVAERQRAEILKALYLESDLIILDEPTTVLTPQESDALFHSLRVLAERGKTIILITHRLPEVMSVTDEVTVLRSGRIIATKRTRETTQSELAMDMVGREVRLRRTRSKVAVEQERVGAVTLSVENLFVNDDLSYPRVNGVSFSVGVGEIVGIAAVQGNGQAELVEALFGLRESVSGRVKFLGKDVTSVSTKARREMGMQYVPRERLKRGINGGAAIFENLVMGCEDEAPFSSRGVLHERAIREYSRRMIGEFNVAARSTSDLAKTLSGGNQQKLVLSRELRPGATLVIAEEPTQGLDVLATQFVHDTLLKVRDSMNSVLLVSSSLDEVIDLSDKIVVMYAGKIMGVLSYFEATEQEVGKLMMGIAVVGKGTKKE